MMYVSIWGVAPKSRTRVPYSVRLSLPPTLTNARAARSLTSSALRRVEDRTTTAVSNWRPLPMPRTTVRYSYRG